VNIIGIIPARGGSKGINRKNLAMIKNKPLVGHSIDHAFSSSFISRVIVTTEDKEIRDVALDYGADVPFIRPAELAEDHVLDLPCFQHALNFINENEGYKADIVVHLRPTAPYRKSKWIDEAIELLIENPKADSVRSVSIPDKHPYRIFQIDKYGYLDPIMKHEHPTPYNLRRQDLPVMYYYNCVIDVTKPTTIFDKNSMTGDKIIPYIMNPDEVIDIDTPFDLELAKYLFNIKNIS